MGCNVKDPKPEKSEEPAVLALVTLDDARSDAELIEAVRRGVVSAYGALFTRHRGAAKNLAMTFSRNTHDGDELVAEAFAKVLDALLAGHGPTTGFRGYLHTTLRHIAYDRTRRTKKIHLIADIAHMSGPPVDAVTVPFVDTAIAALDRALAAKAFTTLPERWQTVLWHTEVEQLPLREVAVLMGLNCSAVASLAYRARAGLRTAYLQAQLVSDASAACRSTRGQLAAHLRGQLSGRAAGKVGAHLAECDRCRRHRDQLGELNVDIPA